MSSKLKHLHDELLSLNRNIYFNYDEGKLLKETAKIIRSLDLITEFPQPVLGDIKRALDEFNKLGSVKQSEAVVGNFVRSLFHDIAQRFHLTCDDQFIKDSYDQLLIDRQKIPKVGDTVLLRTGNRRAYKPRILTDIVKASCWAGGYRIMVKGSKTQFGANHIKGWILL